MGDPYAPPKADGEPPRVREEPEHPRAEAPPPTPPIRDDDRFVALYTPGDPLEGSMLVQALEAEGIATTGASQATGATVGAGFAVGLTPVFVPARQLEAAQEVLAAFVAGAPGASELEEDEPAAAAEGPSRRRGLVRIVTWVAIVGFVLLWRWLSVR
jgi:hypothetical protein